MRATLLEGPTPRRSAARGFCATPAARALRDAVLEQAASYAATPGGRGRIRALQPCATPEDADRHAAWVMEQAAQVRGLDREGVRKCLRAIREPVEPQPAFDTARRVVATPDEQDRLLRLGVHRWAALGGLGDLRHAADAELVVVVHDGEADLDGIDSAVEVAAGAPLEAIAPEAALAWFAANRATLEAVRDLASLRGQPSAAPEALGLLAEAGGLRAARIDLRREAEAVLKLAQAALQARMASLSLTGLDLLDSLGRRLPAPVQKALEDTLAEAREAMQTRTGRRVQPLKPSLPLELDENELERLEAEVAARSQRDRFAALARLARRLAPLRPRLEAEVAAALAWDHAFALGCFAHELGLQPARWEASLHFSDSVHLGLATQPAAQRIHYQLGEEESVAILTGANSGGKTTLLEHVGQLAVLARHGLPVVGEAGLPWVDELHLVTARRSLDAGAFESFLKSFLPVAQGDARRLVLADEVESVTELEAAGRILGFFLDRLARTESLAIVVSHVAPQILRHTQAPVRVDGIEATGLDARNRLVVDRQPRMGRLARSTPELIIQRLAATSKGEARGLFTELLAHFQTSVAADAATVSPRKTLRRKPASAQP